MKSSFITFASLFIFLIGAVVAAPTTLDSTEIVKRQGFQEVDAILNEAYNSLVQKNTVYNATTTVTSANVKTYCDDIVVIINVAITKCGLIPAGNIFLDINLIASLLFKILCEINYTLQLLLSKCGLLALLFSLILLILSLVGGLIAALNSLLVVVAGVCGTGLLQLLLTLILNNCGSGFLLLVLGLII